MIPLSRKELITALAKLLTTVDSAKMIVDFTKIEKVNIDFSGNSMAMWNKIINEADKHRGGRKEVLEMVNSEYRDDKIISRALKELQDIESFDDIPTEYVPTVDIGIIPFGNAIANINKDSFGEIRRVDCNRSKQIKHYYSKNTTNCTITFIVGEDNDMPNSFAERISLQTLENSQNIDNSSNNCWVYRKPNGNSRIDEIPFDIQPNLQTSQNVFAAKMETLFQNLNFDNLSEYFTSSTYKNVVISINYNYTVGDDILSSFTKWLYQKFSTVTETTIEIFIVLTESMSIDNIMDNLQQIQSEVDPKSIVLVNTNNTVSKSDIATWKRQINLEPYAQEDFLEDLKNSKVSADAIQDFENREMLSMRNMEQFQNKLYDAFYK